MNCPKCGGEAYLVEEEFVKVLENMDPPKIVAKAVYQCKSCGDRFSRLVYEDLSTKRKEEHHPALPPGSTGPEPGSMDPRDRLKFF